MTSKPGWAQPGIRTIAELVKSMKDGDLALPEFQRDFVWDPADIQALLVSVLAQYPSGTLLFLDKGASQFKHRSFASAGGKTTKDDAALVLDGQQRLTAVFQALMGVGDAEFYVNLDAARSALEDSGGDGTANQMDETFEFRLRRSKGQKAPLSDQSEQIRHLRLPVRMLLADEHLDWAIRADEERDDVSLHELLKLVAEVKDRLLNYGFPVVTLPASTPTDAVCKIFETMNLRGVKLGVFELLTARFWPAKVDLRARWDEATSKHPIIGPDDFNLDPYYLLQAVSVRATRARTPSNKPPSASAQRADVLKLTAQDFTEYWDEVVDGAAAALSHLRGNCGVLSGNLLPYSLVLVPMAASWHLVTAAKGAVKGKRIAMMERFFWCTVFMRNYDQGGNSQAGRDSVDLERWFDGGEPPEAVADFSFDPETLDQAKTNLKALYRGVLALELRHGAQDFHTGGKLTHEMLMAKKVDSHHVFPRAWLDQQTPPSESSSELILNRALLDKQTNQSIGKRAPSDYLSDVRTHLGDTKFRAVLISHLIPSEPLWSNSYTDFVAARRILIAAEIEKVTSE